MAAAASLKNRSLDMDGSRDVTSPLFRDSLSSVVWD